MNRPTIKAAAFLILNASLLTRGLALFAQSAGSYQLAKVDAEGSKRYKDSDVVRATGLKVGATVTLDTLRKAAENLGTMGIFGQVSYGYTILGKTITADFTVQDAPGLLPCTFDNFIWFSPQELQDGLRSHLPLFSGYVPQGGKMLDLISAQLQAMLEARGIHAQVEFTPHGKIGGPIQSMGFHETGVPLPVRRLEFPGAAQVDAALLQEVGKPLLDNDYDPSYIRDYAQGTISIVYRQRGYLKAAFGEPTPSLLTGDATPNAVAVSIPVTEGEQYLLKEIDWSGDSAIPYAELGTNLHAPVGSPLDAPQLEHDVMNLSLLFHPRGYLKGDAKFTSQLDDEAHSAVVHIQIQQGALYHMGTLEILGLDDARAAALAKRSQLRTGDPYDYTYWGRFFSQVNDRLPLTETGWKVDAHTTINEDAKTVDVKLTFAPRASH